MDTNVFTAALLSASGSNREVLRACLSGRATPLMGTALFHEYEDILGRAHLMCKSPLGKSEQTALFRAFLSVAEWVKVFYLWRPNLPDEGDNHLVELAVAGTARSIVTNNLDDLRRGELRFPGLAVLTPKQFLATIP